MFALKVLLIRFTWLGDVALVSSVAHLLRDAGHEAWLLTRRPFGELFLRDRDLEVMETEPREGFSDLLKRIRGNFDAVFDLQAKALSLGLTLLSGARIRRVYRKRALARRAAVWFKRPLDFVPVHELYAGVVKKALGISEPCPGPKLFPPETGPALPEDFVVLAPGARHPTRAWPGFLDLARALLDQGREVVWVGLPGEGPGGAPGLDMRGKTSLPDLLYVISKARVLVSGDTGPMHLARALGVPVVALFGPTLPEFGFGPLPGEGVVLQEDMDCRPCSLHGERPCPGDLACLRGIDPGRVLAEIERMGL